MNISNEKLFLRSIAASWAKRRNMGGLTQEELQHMQALRIQAKVYTKEEEGGSTWVMLTESGWKRLYELNAMRDI